MTVDADDGRYPLPRCPICDEYMARPSIEQPGISGTFGDPVCMNRSCVSTAINPDVHLATVELLDLRLLHVGMCAKLSEEHFHDPETGADLLEGLWAFERRLEVLIERIELSNSKRRRR